MVERALFFTQDWMVPFAAAIAVAMGVVIVWLYRAERRMISRRTGILLTVLRVILVVILLVMLTEPVIRITRTNPQRGTVIIMLDNSESMQISDRGMPPYERLRLAEALGLLPKNIHRSNLSPVTESLSAVLSDVDSTSRRWAEFAKSMSLGVLDDAERDRELDEMLLATQEVRGGIASVAQSLQDARVAAKSLPGDVGAGVDKTGTELGELNARSVDEIIRELSSAEFRSRLTVGRRRRINELFGRIGARMSDVTSRMRDLIIRHDTALAAEAVKLAPDAMDRVARMSRLDLAAALLADSHVNVLGRLNERYNVRSFLFARRQSELPVRIDADNTSVQAAPPAARSEALYTNLSDNLKQAEAAAEGEEIGGIIILSDGRFNHGDDPVKTARLLGSRDVRLYPVTVGSEVSPTDIAVVKVDVADVVYDKDAVEARIIIKTAGCGGRHLMLTVREKGKAVVQKAFDVPALADRVSVAVSFVPQGPGQHNYIVTLPVEPQEVFRSNNEKPFAISVIDKKTRVLMVDGGPRWEYRYLKNALLRDKRIELKYLLFNPLTTSRQEIIRAREAFPNTREKLFAYDTVIFGDVDPDQLSPEDLLNLESFVTDRGGTMIVIAGRSFMPSSYVETPLGRALPVLARDSSVNGDVPPEGFALSLTDEARDSTIFRLSPDEKGNEEAWVKLPKMLWYSPIRDVKPGATVWARAQNPGENAADTGGRKADTRAVIVSHAYGLGRVFYMGIDGTWRWRYKVADEYFHRFWGQLLRWATSGKLPVGTDRVKLGTDKFEYVDGDDVVVRARVLSDRKLPVSDAMVSATLVRKTDDREVGATRLEYLRDSGGHYEGRFRNVLPGSYAVKLNIPGMEDELKELSSDLEVKDAPTRELVELSADPRAMSDLAVAAAGRSFALDELARVPDALRTLKLQETHVTEITLWDSWWLLLLFCAIITVEWAVRKRQGLL